jgi:biotin-dependent carboxylase-like uncharacterized protein
MTTGRLIIRAPGGMTTIQDAGRIGSAFFAFPRCGAMDGQSAGLANVLVRNDRNAPVLESTLVAPRIEFQTHGCFALTGADFGWRLDGRPVERNRVIEVAAGSLLEGGKATGGLRGYIAIAGKWLVERPLGSASSHVVAGLGANQGQPLRAGFELEWEQPEIQPGTVELVISPGRRAKNVIRTVRGPEFEWLEEESKQLLLEKTYRVSPTSNRMGARLEGPALSVIGKTLPASVPVLPGMIQLTPSGQAIVVLQDGQTTGGYPRIGYVPRSELDAFNQIMIGDPFRFVLL